MLRKLAQRAAVALDALGRSDVEAVVRSRKAGLFRLPIIHGDLRRDMQPTIVDVGAARGESGTLALSAFPEATIYSFEPVPTEYAALELRAKSHAKWSTFPFALGSTTERRDMVVCDGLMQASSFFTPADLTAQAWPEYDFAKRSSVRVEVTTLDAFAESQGISQVDILKLDVQGAELEVLEGGAKTLQRTKYVIAEVAFQRMYEGGCLVSDVLSFLHDRGKVLRALSGEVRDSSGRLLQADALFG